MTDDHLHQVLVSLVFSEVLEFLLGLIGDVTGPLRQLVRLILRVLELLAEDLLDLLLGLGGAELVLERRADLVGLIALCHLFAHLLNLY